MKRIFRRVISVVLALVVLTSASVAGAAKGTVEFFSDVPRSYWGYDTIMSMTYAGLFKGTGDPVNGVGTFSPENSMTRAEFVVVALRATYPNEAAAVKNYPAVDWWRNYYTLALEKGLLLPSELDGGKLGVPMTRQEMAMVLVRCVRANGETVSGMVPVSQIADYASVGAYYKEYVRECFSFGLICGIDEKGTFAPGMSLTRAQGATVLCRLTDEGMRVDTSLWDVLPWEEPGAKQPQNYTWAEFEALSDAQKDAFFDSFPTPEALDAWLTKHGHKPENDNGNGNQSGTQSGNQGSGDTSGGMATGDPDVQIMPWEKDGAKQPEEYTWAEYQKLTNAQKEVFSDAFATPDGYDNWLASVKP